MTNNKELQLIDFSLNSLTTTQNKKQHRDLCTATFFSMVLILSHVHLQ